MVQVADGVLHLTREKVPDTCEVEALRRRVAALEARLARVLRWADGLFPGPGNGGVWSRRRGTR